MSADNIGAMVKQPRFEQLETGISDTNQSQASNNCVRKAELAATKAEELFRACRRTQCLKNKHLQLLCISLSGFIPEESGEFSEIMIRLDS